MIFSFCPVYGHGVCLLRTFSMIIVLRMDRRRDFVGYYAHFLHDVYLATHGPRVGIPVVPYRHHPESRPSTFAFRQENTRLKITILPTGIHLGIHTTGINLTVAAFEAVDVQLTVSKFRHTLSVYLSVHVVLQFIVHPTGFLDFVSPVVTQCSAFIEFILPYQ